MWNDSMAGFFDNEKGLSQQRYEMDTFTDFIKGHEGKKLTAYKPVKTEKYYTIGYGHYGSDVTKGMTITDEQADEYLRKDINKRLPAVKKAIEGFDNMPLNVKKNILGSWFRGSLTASGSPTTIRLLNEGKYKEASKEFLNNAEYRKYKNNPGTMDGVVKRMEATANALASLK
jgi:GH24 family phage-related lysozyme (muramidase)